MDDIEFLLELNSQKPCEPPPKYITDYIEGRRVMPSNTPIPGIVEFSKTQYAVEILNCLSPWNPTQYVDLMCAAQVVKTFIMENVIGFYIGATPAPMLFMSGTDVLLNKWSTKRLEPLVDSLDLRKRFISPIENAKTRKTGDTSNQKLFSGGFLEMSSAQSPASMRSDSVRILLLDEVDSAPELLTTGEGYWDEVAEARTSYWGNRKKILACSTPTEYYKSTIYRRFLLGDQCEYFVPCPLCGKFQILNRGSENGSHGLRCEMKNGQIDYVYYICEFCHDAIFEHQKPEMIKNGQWRPMAKPERLRRSFHLNALLAPLGAFSWIDYMTSYHKAQRMPDGMRSFTNLRDGLVYIDEGVRPKIEKVLENKGMYQSGYVPDGVLYITIGADVQRGSKNDPDNPPRIEMEVLGIGYGYRTWSIEYKVFVGAIDDPFSGAWEKMHQYMIERNFEYIRKSDNFKFPIQLIFIDSGDGEFTDVVYRFTGRWHSTFPIKGQKTVQRKRTGKIDESSDSDFHRYKPSKINEETTIYLISTVYYKNQVYNNLVIRRRSENPQKPGFCDFPYDYTEKYFKMLTSEEKMTDGSFDSKGRRNEALDTRVYALCAADVWLDGELFRYKQWAKENGWRRSEIEKISHRNVIDNLIEQTAKK